MLYLVPPCVQSETLVTELRHELRQVRGKYQAANRSQGSGGQQPRVEDTVIVQNVGAPFAVLQWREADSIMNCGYDMHSLPVCRMCPD